MPELDIALPSEVTEQRTEAVAPPPDTPVNRGGRLNRRWFVTRSATAGVAVAATALAESKLGMLARLF